METKVEQFKKRMKANNIPKRSREILMKVLYKGNSPNNIKSQ